MSYFQSMLAYVNIFLREAIFNLKLLMRLVNLIVRAISSQQKNMNQWMSVKKINWHLTDMYLEIIRSKKLESFMRDFLALFTKQEDGQSGLRDWLMGF